MSDALAPADEAAMATAIADAHSNAQPLLVQGNASKQGMLRPVQAARTISARALAGIGLYAPAELILTAGAGTPVKKL